MKAKMFLPFIILAAVPFIMVLGNSMLIPIFPQIKQALDLTPFQVGLIITLFSLPAGLLIPFAGAFSDHVGRKTIMAPSLLIYGCGGLLAGVASVFIPHPYPWILVGRVIQGIGAGGTYQLAMALTSDVFTSTERTKVLGYLEAANGFGKVLSPLLGAALGLISWYVPFFAYGLLALPIALCVWLFVKEPESKGAKMTPKEYLQKLREVFRAKAASLLSAYTAGAIGLFLLFGMLSYLSDELETKFHIAGFVKGGVLAIPVGMMSLTAFFGGLFLESHRKLLKPAVITGLALITIGMTSLPLGRQAVIPFVSLATLVALGIGMLLPPLNTLITSATSPDERGLVTCLYGTVRFFGVAAGPPIFGLLSTHHIGLMFLGGAAIAALGAVIALIWLDPRMMVEEKQGKA
ncbi:MAG TPA: MFS transporter [Firmicutes bacterium]|nr:MFS transporter [Bacillota bacterium]